MTNQLSYQAAYGDAPLAIAANKYQTAGYKSETIASKAGGIFCQGVSPHQALERADLNFTAEKRELFYMGIDGHRAINTHCSIVNSKNDAFLGSFKSGYEVVQHSQLALILERLGDSAEIEQVLSIRGGAKAYITAKVAVGSIGGDEVVRHLHLFNSHDGSSSFGAMFSDTRLYCANQLGTITRGKSFDELLRHGHTSGIHSFISNLVSRIDTEKGLFLSEMDALAKLRSMPTNTELNRRILEVTFKNDLAKPIKDKRSKELRQRVLEDLPIYPKVVENFVTNAGIATDSEEVNNSVYRLFNATTQALTHGFVRTTRDPIGQARARFESLMGGAAAAQIDSCKQACLSLV